MRLREDSGSIFREHFRTQTQSDSDSADSFFSPTSVHFHMATPTGSSPAAQPQPPRASELAMAQAALDAYAAPCARGRYTLVKLVGRGAYGAVYSALERLAPQPPSPSDGGASGGGAPPPAADGPPPPGTRRVAVKHIINAFVSPTDARRMYREIKVMSHFCHPNVLALLEVVRPADAAGFQHIYLVSELMETDLHRVVQSRQDLSSDHVSFFMYQLLAALAHVHAAGVLHRDLKASNLLLNGDCTLRLCDFGLAREGDSSLSAAFTEYVVTRFYRAPEVLLSGGRYTSAIDVWSAGCVLGELLLRRPLFPGENYLHQLQLITETLGSPSEEDLAFVRAPAARSFMLRLPRCAGTPLAQLFPHVRGPVLDLLGRMLQFDPAKRADVAECLAHPFLARVRAARRGVNEDAVPRPPRFKLRVPGGAAGLRGLSVAGLKARFYAELCGQPLTPTPGAAAAAGALSWSDGALAAAAAGPPPLPLPALSPRRPSTVAAAGGELGAGAGGAPTPGAPAAASGGSRRAGVTTTVALAATDEEAAAAAVPAAGGAHGSGSGPATQPPPHHQPPLPPTAAVRAAADEPQWRRADTPGSSRRGVGGASTTACYPPPPPRAATIVAMRGVGGLGAGTTSLGGPGAADPMGGRRSDDRRGGDADEEDDDDVDEGDDDDEEDDEEDAASRAFFEREAAARHEAAALLIARAAAAATAAAARGSGGHPAAACCQAPGPQLLAASPIPGVPVSGGGCAAAARLAASTTLTAPPPPATAPAPTRLVAATTTAAAVPGTVARRAAGAGGAAPVGARR